jgi:hypothetical protein
MATKIDPVVKILNQYTYEFKKDKSNRKKQVYFIKTNDRTRTQKEIEAQLNKAKIPNRQEKSSLSGSTKVTVIPTPLPTVKDNVTILVFKPASGGMAETTLNSTITELAPALGFVNKMNVKTVEEFYAKLKLVDHKKSSVYVAPRDIKAGEDFVNNFPKSSKFKIKMENAMGVLNWLKGENKVNPISNVFWGYRAKPEGVDSKHKGDLFVVYKTGKMLGVSLKAGEEKSSEPKLNTYVNPILEKINPTAIQELRTLLFEKVYKQVGITSINYDKLEKKQTITKLAELEKSDEKRYNELYDMSLGIIRDTLIHSFEKNVKTSVEYLRKAITGQDGAVPLLVLKAYGTQVKILTDEDDVEVFLNKTKKIKAYASTTSKQDFFIELINTPADKLVMKFSVRTNKTGDEHKLGQFFNLAVKFNGIK